MRSPGILSVDSLGLKNSKLSRLAGAAPQAGAAMRLEAGAAGISPRSAYHMISLSLLGAALFDKHIDSVWKSTHVLQPAKKLNNSAVSKPRGEGKIGKKLDLFFDAKPFKTRASEEKYLIKRQKSKRNMARAARRKKIQICSFQKFKTTKRARIFQNLDSYQNFYRSHDQRKWQ